MSAAADPPIIPIRQRTKQPFNPEEYLRQAEKAKQSAQSVAVPSVSVPIQDVASPVVEPASSAPKDQKSKNKKTKDKKSKQNEEIQASPAPSPPISSFAVLPSPATPSSQPPVASKKDRQQPASFQKQPPIAPKQKQSPAPIVVSEPTKVVIGSLPPLLKESTLVDALSASMTDLDTRVLYFQFVPGAHSANGRKFCYSYAIIGFASTADVTEFVKKWENHIFLDAKGTEFRATVEFALNQRMPHIPSKADPRENTIEEDEEYIKFVESLSSKDKKKTPAEEFSTAAVDWRDMDDRPSANAKKSVVMSSMLQFLLNKQKAPSTPATASTSAKDKVKPSARESKLQQKATVPPSPAAPAPVSAAIAGANPTIAKRAAPTKPSSLSSSAISKQQSGLKQQEPPPQKSPELDDLELAMQLEVSASISSPTPSPASSSSAASSSSKKQPKKEAVPPPAIPKKAAEAPAPSPSVIPIKHRQPRDAAASLSTPTPSGPPPPLPPVQQHQQQLQPQPEPKKEKKPVAEVPQPQPQPQPQPAPVVTAAGVIPYRVRKSRTSEPNEGSSGNNT